MSCYLLGPKQVEMFRTCLLWFEGTKDSAVFSFIMQAATYRGAAAALDKAISEFPYFPHKLFMAIGGNIYRYWSSRYLARERAVKIQCDLKLLLDQLVISRLEGSWRNDLWRPYAAFIVEGIEECLQLLNIYGLHRWPERLQVAKLEEFIKAIYPILERSSLGQVTKILTWQVKYKEDPLGSASYVGLLGEIHHLRDGKDCSNSSCPKKRGPETTALLSRCSGCKVLVYRSQQCQKKT